MTLNDARCTEHSSRMPPVVGQWLRFIKSGDAAHLSGLIDSDVVFFSPAVFTPQVGRDKVVSYLVAAEKMFSHSNFQYAETWCGERSAILEFNVNLDGTLIEGVDIIRWNDEDQITSFKVMIRPLKGLQTVIPIMGELLQRPHD